MAKDVVCGMYVDEHNTPFKVSRGGSIYYFCSAGCMRAFEAPYAELRYMKRLAALSLALAVPITILSFLDLEMPLLPRPYWLLALALPVQAIGGLPFYRGAADAIRARVANMDLLIALGTLAAFSYSALSTLLPSLLPSQGFYYDVSAVIIALILLGRLAERAAKRSASEALRRLMQLQPSKARVLRDGREVEVPVEEVSEGEVVVVRAGEGIPVDGVVVEGSAAIDQASMTGEGVPVDKGPGDYVLAATVNLSGLLKVRATKVGQDTAFSQVIKVVERAQLSTVPIQRLADRISAYFVPAVIGLALGSSLAWALLGMGAGFSLLIGVAVLIIACPCALGIATPAALVVGVGKAAQAGVLIKEPEQLQKLEKVTTLVLDKTGTLTKGVPRVVRFRALGDEAEVLAAIAAASGGSAHPLSKAVAAWIESMGPAKQVPERVEEVPGKGIRALWQGKEVLLGNLKLMREVEAELGEAQKEAEGMEREGMTVLYVAIDRRLRALLGLQDELKEGAREAVHELKGMGLEVILLTGDNERAARAVAEKLGIERWISDVLPDEKARVIEELKEGGKVVAMVGDGINDAPALALADVGIAIGNAADIAKQAGGIVLTRGDPRDIVKAIALGRKIMGKIKQNLFWAFAYNVCLLPVAAGALYPAFGILLNPMLAAGAMALSSVTVVGNSLLLQRLKL